ncbi:MAG: outer membrane protein transport protein [Gammaproteobacteria bacterium]
MSGIVFIRRQLVVFGITSLFSTVSLGAGFEVPHKSIYGVGLANAVVADVTGYGATPYNPALMILYPGFSGSVGALVNRPENEVRLSATGSSVEGQRDDTFVAPYLFGSGQINDYFWAGIAAHAPFGQGTDWPAGTFTASGPLQALTPTETFARIVTIAPVVAYRLNDNVGFSLGADVYRVTKVELNTTVTQLEGDGDGVGWQIGAFLRQGLWSFGAHYHSPATLDLEGNSESPLGKIAIESGLELPYRFQMGLQYQASQKISAEFDFVRVGWSSYDTLDVTNKSTGALLSRVNNNWRDVNGLRFGVKYRYSDRFTFTTGYTHERTPQADQYFSPRTPGSNRNAYSLGAEYRANRNIVINLGYIFVDLNDRQPETTGPQTTADHNGTDTIAGDYKSSLHALGMSFTYQYY